MTSTLLAMALPLRQSPARLACRTFAFLRRLRRMRAVSARLRLSDWESECVLLGRQHRAFAPGANKPARHGAGMLAALEDRVSGAHGVFLARDALHEAPAASRHVVDEFGFAHFEIVEVDHINVG